MSHIVKPYQSMFPIYKVELSDRFIKLNARCQLKELPSSKVPIPVPGDENQNTSCRHLGLMKGSQGMSQRG